MNTILDQCNSIASDIVNGLSPIAFVCSGRHIRVYPPGDHWRIGRFVLKDNDKLWSLFQKDGYEAVEGVLNNKEFKWVLLSESDWFLERIARWSEEWAKCK